MQRRQATVGLVGYQAMFREWPTWKMTRNRLKVERIRTAIAKVIPFDKAKEARDYLALGCEKGNVVVRIK